jgi:peptidoglycan/LPS O-acetylase OafA/YrhL
MPESFKRNFITFKECLSADITSVPEALQPNYLFSLNGIRGIAIILVVMSHLQLCRNSYYDYYQMFFNGQLGVGIFFVLSGFLITTLCLKEKIVTGDLSLKKFYTRRILRIFPVAYLYLAVILVLNYWLNLKIPAFQFLGAAFYILNLSYFRRHESSALLGHYWSLATEEQFYLIFPFLIKKSFKTFVLFIIFLVILLPLVCTLQEFYRPVNTGALYAFTHMAIKFQGIAVGCLFSILSFEVRSYYDIVGRYKILGNLLALSLIVLLRLDFFYSIRAIYTNLFIAILIGYFITSNIKPANDVIFKLLNSRILSWIGILSYSIYIWQQFFAFGDPGFATIIKTFPYNAIFIITAACLSYYLFEKRFLKLKAKFKVRSSQNNENTDEALSPAIAPVLPNVD